MKTAEEHNDDQVMILFAKLFKTWHSFNQYVSAREIAETIQKLSQETLDNLL